MLVAHSLLVFQDNFSIYRFKLFLFQIYSLIFIFCSPVTAAVMPIVLFGVLHAASYTLTLLDQVIYRRFK